MTKLGQIVCQRCNWTTDGELPDDQPEGYIYFLADYGITPKETFVANVLLHHIKTRPEGGWAGHRLYDVFLQNGETGEIEANSYCVVYTEHGGKERK